MTSIKTKIIDLDINHDKLQYEVVTSSLWEEIVNNKQGVCLQYRKGVPKEKQLTDALGNTHYDWDSYTGEGLPPERSVPINLEEYKYTTEAIKGMYLEEVLEKLKEKYDVYKTRLLLVSPKQALITHKDTTPRVHIPIVTDTRFCYMIIEEEIIKLPFGNTYWVDTTRRHTAINTSLENRVHFVACIREKI